MQIYYTAFALKIRKSVQCEGLELLFIVPVRFKPVQFTGPVLE